MASAAEGSASFAKRARADENSPASAPDLPGSESSAFGESTEAIECGVNLIHASDVWTLGVRGEGIVVASMDTGVDWTHPAIQSKYRGWNSGNPDHSYSWHDSIQHTVVPLDDHGHGTHTTGTMVGDDGGANQIGVAPKAKWIACRNMDHGNGQPSTYLECMQWGLAPYPQGADPLVDGRPDLAADITNNSWGCPPSEGCDALTLQSAFETLRAAGQMTVAAAGNSGSSCSTVSDPPAIYDAVFTVGAMSCSTGNPASFSSRGPVTIDGSNRMKPNVAAPGVSVRSSYPGAGYANFSGTSMASPHTAGAIALLWSAKPNLRHLIRISRCYMERSTGVMSGSTQTCGGIPPSTRPNNIWGWGLINALAAIDLGPDGDGDGIADVCDCASGNGGVFDAPPEVAEVTYAVNKNDLSWASQATLAGPGTSYDIVRGSVADLKATGGFLGATCLDNNHGSASISDTQLPPLADAFYYLVRGQNSCGSGTYGNRSNGLPRVISACP